MEAYLIEDFIALWYEMDEVMRQVEAPVIGGKFYGYINEGGWPCGVFYAEDGRLIEAGNDFTRELVAV
jgi:hypothetical protein